MNLKSFILTFRHQIECRSLHPKRRSCDSLNRIRGYITPGCYARRGCFAEIFCSRLGIGSLSGETCDDMYLMHCEKSLTVAIQGALFKSFSQADESTTRLYGGTGLGLAVRSFCHVTHIRHPDALCQISRSLAKLLGGDAWIDASTRLGSGSIFWFSCIVNKGRPLEPRKPLVIPSGLRRVTVCAPPIVTQGMLLNELRVWGFDTETVDNIQAIKFHVEAERFDILIVDPLYTSEDDRVILESLTRYVSVCSCPSTNHH
jgi:hypothetical protein